MNTVIQTEPGVLELNWQWLPTWFGMNAMLKQELEDTLKSQIVGKELTHELLEEVDNLVIDFIEQKAPHVDGLRDLLDGLKFVSIKPTKTAGR